MLATHVGGMAWLEWDHLNQNKNWSRYSRGSDDNNADKHLSTEFVTLGVQKVIDSRWSYSAELPYWRRYFKTADPASGNEGIFKHGSIGDIRLRAIYTGLSTDMSTGLTAGLRLPTGSYTSPGFDRDTQIGSGSTDLLLGGYKVLALNGDWSVFANFQHDQPVFVSGGYRPGAELDAAVGGYYAGWLLGPIKTSPILQVVGSHRWRDQGILAHSNDTGYDRVVVSPGFEASKGPYRVNAGVGFPVYLYVHGNQLVASQFYKLTVGYAFGGDSSGL
jgi:hypothetical protein